MEMFFNKLLDNLLTRDKEDHNRSSPPKI